MSTSIAQRSGTLLKASPPDDAREVDRRAVEEVGGLARLKGSVSMRRKTSRALRIALSPSHGVEPCARGPLTSTRTASTPLAWTPMWRSVGSPVIAKSARRPSRDQRVGRAARRRPRTPRRGRRAKRTRTRSCAAASRTAHIIDGERALHVVGAAADEAVALDARRRTAPRAPGTTSRWPWRITVGPRRAGPTSARIDRQAVVSAARDRDLARLEPALDEAGGGAQPFGLGRVVADQALGQDPLVHPGQDRARRRSHPAVPALRDMFGAMAAQIVLFGATGYTGELTARALVERGARPVLAARSRGAWRRSRRPSAGSRRAWPTSATRPRSRALVGARRRARQHGRALRALRRARGRGRGRRGRPLPRLDRRGAVHPRRLRAPRPAGAAGRVGAADGHGLRLRARQRRRRARAARGGRAPPPRSRSATSRRLRGASGGTRASAAAVALEPAFAARRRGGRRARRRRDLATFERAAGGGRPRSSVGATRGARAAPACTRRCATSTSTSAAFGRASRADAGRVGASLGRRARARRHARPRHGPGRLVKGSTGGPDAAAPGPRVDDGRGAGRSGPGGERLAQVRLEGGDAYDFTARMLAWAAEQIAGGALRGTGALGPVDAFGLDARRGRHGRGRDRAGGLAADAGRSGGDGLSRARPAAGSAPRSLWSPRRTRLLTVPSGIPSRAAISAAVSPPT